MSQKLKRITIAILGVLLFLSIASSLLFYDNGKNNVASAETCSVPSIVAQENYALNAKATFPEAIQVEYKGSMVDATGGIIIFPNGKTYSIEEDKEFTLTTIGTYVVKYFYDSNDASVVFEDEFVINNALYSLSDELGSSVTPVKKADTAGQTYLNVKSNVGSTGADVLIARLKDGVKFTYEEPIDLSQKSDDGLSNVITFDPKLAEVFYDEEYDESGKPGQEMWINGSRKKDIYATRMDIVLTDAYDPTINVTITVELKGEAYYLRANTQDTGSKALLVPSAWTQSNPNVAAAYYGSQRGIIWSNDYGFSPSVYHHTTGYGAAISVRMDCEKGLLYAGNVPVKKDDKGNIVPVNVKYGSTDYEEVSKINNRLFMDFNFADINGGIPYKGFTTGEVYLSLKISNFSKPAPARVDILSIGNNNALDIMDREEGGYKDEKAPVIKTDFEPTDNNGVYVGVGEEFVIPTATAYDVNLRGGVGVSVYRNYGLSTQTNVGVKNNKFTISKEDVYYIVYSAEDYFGNKAEKVIKVFGVDLGGQGAVLIDTSQKIANGTKIGQEILFPLGEKILTINNYKNLKLKIELVSSQDRILIADLKNGNEIDEFWAKDTYFTLQKAGEYKAIYTYSDNAVSGVCEYSFNAVANDVSIFEGKPFIPRLLLKQAVYEFDMVNILSYQSGKAEIVGLSQELQISFDGGAFTKINDIKNVKITGSKTAQLKAIYKGAEILSDVAIIKDVDFDSADKKLNIVNYFHSEDEFIAPNVDPNYPRQSKTLLLTTEKKSGDAKLQFANIIAITEFKLSYKVESSYARFKQLNFVLTDPYNVENKYVFSFYTESGATFFTNGTQTLKLTTSFVDNKTKNISYDAETKVLSVSGAGSSGIVMDIDFTIPVAYLDIEFIGINGTAGITIENLNNQALSTMTRDSAVPTAIINPLVGSYGVGDIITLPSVYFVDVLSQVNSSTIKTKFVYDETNAAQTSVDGVALDGVANDYAVSYRVKIDKEGSYAFTFEGYDSFGKKGGSINYIDVVDKTAPTITFNGSIKENVIVYLNVGQWIKLNYSVSDNYTRAEDLVTTIILFDVNSCVTYGDMTNLIFFEEESTYEVSIICIDKAQNVAIKSFKVVATKVEAD